MSSPAGNAVDFPRLTRARLQLMLRHPYLASALARLKVAVTSETWCRTMATDGFNIFAGNAFLDDTPEEQLIGVLAHEVLHVVFGHIDRRGHRDPTLWNVAIDHATNIILQDLGFSLPAYGLCDQCYRGRTAEDIYVDLDTRPCGRIQPKYRVEGFPNHFFSNS